MIKLLPLLLLLPTTVTAFAANSSPRNKSTALKAEQARQPWEFGRFVKQSSKFVSLPNPFRRSSNEVKIEPGEILWTPSSSSFSFGPLDDVVMGGVSSSNFDNDSGSWKGTVTDANNGGFIGIRSFPAFQWDMQSCQGIELKLKGGQGKRFKVVLRDSAEFNGICWTTSIDVGEASFMKLFNKQSGDGVTTVRIPFQKQIPTLFAKTVPNETFNKQSVVGVQVALSKFEYDGDLNPKFALGDVELQILEIKAY
eukprot:CAMPEP_0119005408 /NCGR_PEP_ID=MMETSP1176-20130426/1701_1 /TAXON_ID=265551 /ORGANISM="Synedropsis recta cf, Strain CCMP1620" /LENGTH=252 /DNA_ID=CAMNT_0006957213 /DNA_START=23 /DNA_END=781 /DNA_ORIENTATION=-